MHPHLNNATQHVWITGGGSGIGAELAVQLAAQGHRVAISGRDANRLAAVVSRAPQHIVALPLDVTDAAGMQAATTALQQLVPWLDCVILNAGVCEYTDAGNLQPATFERVMATNFFGLVNTFNAALPLLRSAPARPHLVGISSLASLVGFPRAQAYGSSKAAATYLLDSLRADCGQWLDVTVVNPGFVTTPMTSANDFPMPFLMSASEAARVICQRLPQRPLMLSFPRRLHWLLRIAQLLPALWYRHIVPQLRRRTATP